MNVWRCGRLVAVCVHGSIQVHSQSKGTTQYSLSMACDPFLYARLMLSPVSTAWMHEPTGASGAFEVSAEVTQLPRVCSYGGLVEDLLQFCLPSSLEEVRLWP